MKRRLRVYAGACAAHVNLGPTTLPLYDVTVLYFETEEGDGFRVPVLKAFLDAHRLSGGTVVADAGMVSEANKPAIEAAGLTFGARVPDVPYTVQVWRGAHPDTEIPDGRVFVQPWPAGPGERQDHMIFYQYQANRARRTLRGIDTEVTKAENTVAGKTPVKRNGICD